LKSSNILENSINRGDIENDVINKITTSPSNTKISATSSSHQAISDEIILKGGEELRHQLWESSKRLVKEGEKNVTLALDLETARNNIDLLRKEIQQLRLALLQGIDDEEVDTKDFSNISLCDLLRISLQGGWGGAKHSIMSFSGEFRKLDKIRSDARSCTDEHEIKTKFNRTSDATICKLRQKVADMAERIRKEREVGLKFHRELLVTNDKVEVLSDHIEKLMVHLKHEALSKARILTNRTRAIREVALLKKRSQAIEKRNNRKDKVIAELKEGGKILEEQLQLMDEKYMELKIKLDWFRTKTERIMKKKEDTMRDMQAKFVLKMNT